jgi:hypothetical protein
MLKYYISLISEAFQMLARWGGMIRLLATIAIAIAIFFNAEIGQRILVNWNGFDPIWALLPIGLGGIWAFLKLNYERYELAQNTMGDLRRELTITKESGKAPELLFIHKLAHQTPRTPEGIHVGRKALVAQIDIKNNSQIEFYVTPRLRFSDTSGTALTIDGMWSDRPFRVPKSTIVEPMKFLAGERHKLDLALQFEGEIVWYGIDNASPFAEYKYEKYKLTGTIHITVMLEGNISPITRYFQLREENGIPKFDEIRRDN